MKSCRSFCHLAVALFILLPGGFFICYGVSVAYNHVLPYPSWPFVSDTGNLPPESGIFTLLLVLGAFITLTMMLLYYRYVIHRDRQSKKNKAALGVGIIACFGMIMVASFQWETMLVPHLVGAFVAFVGAIVYSWLIVAVSWSHLVPNIHGKQIIYLRIVLATAETISLILLLIFSGFLQTQREYFIAATISEWILIYAAFLFISTLGYDLSRIRAFVLQLKLYDNHLNSRLEQPLESVHVHVDTI